MKLIVQIDYKFFTCKQFKLVKKHTTSNSKHNEKTNENNDLKYTFSNFQHQDHNITTNDDTSSNSPSFPI